MYDSHCHLQHPRFDADRDDVITRARAAGVTGMLLAGVDAADLALQDAIVARYPELAQCVGLHPMVVAELTDDAVDAELDAVSARVRSRRPAAVGETGLDRRSILPASSLPRQERVFRWHLALAADAGLPVVLHVVRAHELALRVLGDGRTAGVVHSFSGSAEIAQAYVKRGLHVSFCATVTFPEARRIHAACRAVPLDRLLVETDAPDQPPDGARGARNEPGWLPQVIAAVARLREEDPSAIAAATEANARRLYGMTAGG